MKVTKTRSTFAKKFKNRPKKLVSKTERLSVEMTTILKKTLWLIYRRAISGPGLESVSTRRTVTIRVSLSKQLS